MSEEWDAYFIPGTDVLRNKIGRAVHPHGIPDHDVLEVLESEASLLRWVELYTDPTWQARTYDDLKSVHHHLFQDVYDWAGQERTAPIGNAMSKVGPDIVDFEPGDRNAPDRMYLYAPAEEIAGYTTKLFERLRQHDYLRDLPRDTFVDQLAEHWGMLNTIHPFREGNTRTQLLFYNRLAHDAGYDLDVKQLHYGEPLRDPFVEARFYFQATGDHDRLRQVLDQVTTPLDPADEPAPGLLDRARALTERAQARPPAAVGDVETPRLAEPYRERGGMDR